MFWNWDKNRKLLEIFKLEVENNVWEELKFDDEIFFWGDNKVFGTDELIIQWVVEKGSDWEWESFA